MTYAARCLAGVAIVLCFAAVASAQDNAQVKPPAEAAPAAEPAPVPEPGAGPQSRCIAEKDGFMRRGKGIGYAMQLTNNCEARMTCKVFAHINNAMGEARGHGTLTLAPKSKGKAATKTFEMKVKMTGGMIQLSRQCEVL